MAMQPELYQDLEDRFACLEGALLLPCFTDCNDTSSGSSPANGRNRQIPAAPAVDIAKTTSADRQEFFNYVDSKYWRNRGLMAVKSVIRDLLDCRLWMHAALDFPSLAPKERFTTQRSNHDSIPGLQQ